MVLQRASSFMSHIFNKHRPLENTNLADHRHRQIFLAFYVYEIISPLHPWINCFKVVSSKAPFTGKQSLSINVDGQSHLFSMRVLSKVSFQDTTLQYEEYLNLVSKGLGPVIRKTTMS